MSEKMKVIIPPGVKIPKEAEGLIKAFSEWVEKLTPEELNKALEEAERTGEPLKLNDDTSLTNVVGMPGDDDTIN